MTDPKELRKIPKLDKLVALAREGLKAERALAAGPTPEALPEALSDGFLAEAAREVLEQLRQALLSGEAGQAPDEAEIAAAVLREAGRRLAPSLRRVINGTGILLHTNLGRAPLARPALAAIERTAAGYSNLEFDLEEGRPGLAGTRNPFASTRNPPASENRQFGACFWPKKQPSFASKRRFKG